MTYPHDGMMSTSTPDPMGVFNPVSEHVTDAHSTAAQFTPSDVPSIESEYGAGVILQGEVPYFPEMDLPGSGA